MAKSRAAWGIDIGQCALKALRCRYDADSGSLIADAYDYIEYPQLLSQPDADRETLIRDALKEFASRHSTKGDEAAVAVSGQAGLARFVKLPPVEAKKIPEIVAYEAKAQIPFDLEEVIWDFQKLAGGAEEEGFSMETEVGLFAMRKDQVYRALEPLQTARIEPGVVQLSPLAVYNYFLFDQRPDFEEDSPPSKEATVILSMGVDTTDLVATNGHKVWQRSIPLGGSHFTKALTKELKLTFAKAEHLKRNLAGARDAKSAVQAMRSVYTDLVTEVQRSLGFYRSLERGVTVKKIIGLGNPFLLPGLQKFLSAQLEIPVELPKEYARLGGDIGGEPNFKNNLLAYGVCYGLAAQGLRQSRLRTNLAPKEIVRDRIIREKKPWAAAAMAAVLLGCMVNYWFAHAAYSTTQDPDFDRAIPAATNVASRHTQIQTEFTTALESYNNVRELGQAIVGSTEGRLQWLELLKAIDAALPPREKPAPPELSQRKELFISEMSMKEMNEEAGGLAAWWTTTKTDVPWASVMGGGGAGGYGAGGGGSEAAYGGASSYGGGAGYGAPVAPADDVGVSEETDGDAGPDGEGIVIQLRGYHFHNEDAALQGAQYVRETLIDNLKNGVVQLPTNVPGQTETVRMADLGISHPIIRVYTRIKEVPVRDPEAVEKMLEAQQAAAEGGVVPPTGVATAAPMNDPMMMMKMVKKFDFVVQFAWKPTPRSERLRKAAEAAAEAGIGGEDPLTDESGGDVAATAGDGAL